jgi:hypothetical protein
MTTLKVGDILRPTFIGRGMRSYHVTSVSSDTLIVQPYNVARATCYGKAKVTTYSAIVAEWEGHYGNRQGSHLARFESRTVTVREGWGQTHISWNHNPEPKGANL